MSDSSTNLQTDHWHQHPTETATFGVGDSNSPAQADERDVTEALQTSSRYRILGELGRGGMGVVYRVLDNFLGREIAVKSIRASVGAASLTSRFVDEALVMSQLQHPAIPAIYELTIIGGLPFLMMKRIKGVTLAEKIKACATPADRSELIAIFEDVCQAVAYAHGRRIIHRDLKPSNIMVGAFGEVQVMDWGLAKKLEAVKAPEQTPAAAGQIEPPTEVRTTRGADSDHTSPGSVLGTPSFTCPEQSGGEVDKIDERVDVFGLGALLCTILTGQPPYIAETNDKVRLMSIRGDLAPAFARLEQFGADPELIDLCRQCLARDVNLRLRDAKAVADAVAAYRIGVQVRLRAAQESALVLAAEAREQRKRRRVQLALLSSLFLLVSCAAAGVLWNRQQHEHRVAAAGFTAEEALAKAEQLGAQASALKHTANEESAAEARAAVGLWRESAAEAERAESILAATADAELTQRFASRIEAVRNGLKQSQNDLKRLERESQLIQGLDRAHGLAADWIRTRTPTRATKAYEEALLAAGLPAHGAAEALSAAILQESPRVCDAILACIDHWAETKREPAGAQRIRAAANLVDPDPFRRRIRATIAGGAKSDLIELTNLPESDHLPSLSAVLLGRALIRAEEHLLAARVLHAVLEKNPADYWALIEMSYAMAVLEPEQSLGWRDHLSCRRAAQALRPKSGIAVYLVGCSFLINHDAASAEACFQQAVAMDPTVTNAWYNLGWIGEQRNNAEEAIKYYGKAVECDPEFAEARSGLGTWLFNSGELIRAEQELTRAIELKPNMVEANVNLGCLQIRLGNTPGALLSFQTAVLSNPNALIAQVCLGEIRGYHLEWNAAEKQFLKALPLDPKFPLPSKSLGSFYLMRGRLAEAEQLLRKAVELDANDGETHAFLGEVLERRGDLAGAGRCFDQAVKLDPEGNPAAHFDALRVKEHPATAAALERLLAETVKEHPRWTASQKRATRLAAGLAALRSALSESATIDQRARLEFRIAALKLIQGVVKELQDELTRSRVSNAEELLTLSSKLIGDAELESFRGPLPLLILTGPEAGDWFKFWAAIQTAHTQALHPSSP